MQNKDDKLSIEELQKAAKMFENESSNKFHADDLEEFIKQNEGDFFIVPADGGDMNEIIKELDLFKKKHEGKALKYFIRTNGEGVAIVDNELGKDILKKDSMDGLSIESMKEAEEIKWLAYQNQQKGRDRTGSKKNTPKRRKANKVKSKAAKMARRRQRGR